jgi:hypothetical protein
MNKPTPKLLALPVLLPLLLIALSATAQAQDFTYTVDYLDRITITKYNGSGGAVAIPATIDGLPVIAIGDSAFQGCSKLTSVTIPTSVTEIGTYAFQGCTSLIRVTIPDSVIGIGGVAFGVCTSLTSITIPDRVIAFGNSVFYACTNLTSVTLGNGASLSRLSGGGDYLFSDCTKLTDVTLGKGITSIRWGMFQNCSSLARITIPANVTYIEGRAFWGCPSLTALYFQGNAPGDEGSEFEYGGNEIIYYLPGTTGWGETLGGRPTVLWNPMGQTSDATFGVRTNKFGFNITGSSNLVLVVEGSTNLVNWSPVSTNTLNTFVGTNGVSYFSDSQWTNYPGRFYRLRSP